MFDGKKINIRRRCSYLCNGGRRRKIAKVTINGVGIRVIQVFGCGMNVFEDFVRRKGSYQVTGQIVG